MTDKPTYEDLQRRIHEFEKESAERRLMEEAVRESETRARRVAERSVALAEIGRIIGSTLSIDEVYEQFAEGVRRILPFDRLSVGLIHLEQGIHTFPHTSGMDIQQRRKGVTLPLPRTVLDVMRKRSGILFQADPEKGFPEEYPTLQFAFRAGIRSIILTPLISNNEVIGTLFLGSLRPLAYSESDLVLAENVANQISGAIANSQLFAEHERAETALRESEEKFHRAFHYSPMAMSISTLPDGRYLDVNAEFLRLAERTRSEVIGHTALELGSWLDSRKRPGIMEQIGRQGGARDIELELRAKSGKVLTVLWSAEKIVINNEPCLLSSSIDITEPKRTEEEREKLQAQLQQAQKMESVGRLAGGVAHDFNNMLGIIIGNAEMAALQVPPEEPVHQHLQEIIKAGYRSADTVRQLLAFARKQTICPQVLDLNETVSGMLKMLRRLIGEDIELAWIPGNRVGMVRMDPSQVNQILANLVVNSRDAIPGVGNVTIESASAVFDASSCREHTGAVPGEYVRLSVKDTGTGMSPEVMKHLFDPFFTTKEVGKGTGLGLATIYGIVKQNDGFIAVHSEPGQGATFEIYLPRCEGEKVVAPEPVKVSLPEGSETILIAEDEPLLLDIAADILTRQGYTVLAARTPTDGLALSGKHQGRIDLLLTDVVMPEMNGRQLSERLKQSHPGLKCLFMSGYTADVVAPHGVLDQGVHFIEKPFSPKVLAEKVREVLDKS